MLIKVENLSYIYSEGTAFESYALKDVNFEIEENSFVGIIGHTGSGKSTLIQQLNGLLKFNKGKIYYKGQDIYAKDYDMRGHRQKVGLVFQYPEYQLFEIDVLSDVAFGPLNQGLSKEEANELAKKALDLVGLDESFYEKSPFELSGGQKRRVAIAGVLAMKPEVLILDEPTAGLDPKARKQILEQIKNIKEKEGMSIILISHSMEDIAKYTEKVIVLSKGEILMQGSPKDVFINIEELEKNGLKAPEISYVIRDLNLQGFKIKEDILEVEKLKDELVKVLGGINA